jgi:membrane protein required for colicin V production
MIITLFVLVGFWRGFFREIFGLIGIAAGILVGIIGFGPLSKIFHNLFHDVPSFIWLFVSFILLFVSVILLSRLLAAVLSRISQMILLGWLNRLMGGTVGGLKGAAIISLTLLVLGFFPFQDALRHARGKSQLYEPLQKFVPSAYNLLSGFSVDSRKMEKKITDAFEEVQGKIDKEIIHYFFYGKDGSSQVH